MIDRIAASWRVAFARIERRLWGSFSGRQADAPCHAVVRRGWRTTELKFARGVSQSQMLNSDPDRLLIDYTRTMLGSLVLVPHARAIGMIGLGGGSQAKFCHRHLPQARIEVAENNPHVLALRKRFRVPDDDSRLRVHLADGAQWLKERHEAFDLLLVDGYDAQGIAPALSTQAFYDDCRASLKEGGAVAVNLFCADASSHVDRLLQAFGNDHVRVIEEPRQSNRVAFAWRGTPRAGRPSLTERGERELAFEFARLRAMGLGY